MATFSLGTSGITPGAPGVYINERAGLIGTPDLASFSTVYMLVETEENVSTTVFPFNTPIPVTSLADYKVLNGGSVPTSRIPSLSYTCVEEFFNNAQVGDLRVVRVGTPNQIVEVEFFPSGSKVNSTALPSALMAGNVVYVQMIINGLKLVAGDGSTGYTADGEWLGVPVTIPVNYVAGDEVNNRKISAAIAAAVAAAIESNPAVRAAVYVRDFGLTNDLDPTSNSQTSYVTFASTTFDGNVSVVTEVFPVGSNFVFMQNTYDINNIVGQQTAIDRVPQDYTQCIATAFDGQQDQGYLITPTAYAQFDADGRALVGAAAAAHCESNNFKWMALADPGPYLITDVNKYQEFTPHQPAADLVTGMKYLVDNAIYEWTGNDRNSDRLPYQSIVLGGSAQTAVTESASTVGVDVAVGLLDSGSYDLVTIAGFGSSPSSSRGVFQITSSNFWPVTLPIQKVTLSGADDPTSPLYPYNGTEVYVIAPAFTPNEVSTGSYPLNYVYLATTAGAASNIYNQITLAGGTQAAQVASLTPTGCITAAGSGDTFTVSYGDPYWNKPVTINGQTSNLIQNISQSPVGVNTLHLPGTLQDPTETYRLGFVSRTIFDPSNPIGGVSPYGNSGPIATLQIIAGGTGYVAGTYPAVALNGGNGVGATADITVDASGVVTAANLQNAGTGYYVGDVLSAANTALGGTGSGLRLQVATVSGQVINQYSGALEFNVVAHGLKSGQKVYFTQPITVNGVQIIKRTSSIASNPYWVTVIDNNNFVLSNSLTNYTVGGYIQFINGTYLNLPTILYTDILVGGETDTDLQDVGQFPLIRGRKYAFDSSSIFNQASSSALAPAPAAGNAPFSDAPTQSIFINTSAKVLEASLISPYGEDYVTASWLPKLSLPNPTTTPVADVANAYCVPTVDQEFQAEAFLVPAFGEIFGGDYNPTGTGTEGPIPLGAFAGVITGTGYTNGTYTNVYLTGGAGRNAVATITVTAGNVSAVTITNGGWGYSVGDILSAPDAVLGGGGGTFTATVASIVATASAGATGGVALAYSIAAGVPFGSSADSMQAALEAGAITGINFACVAGGFAPDGVTPVAVGQALVAEFDGNKYYWATYDGVYVGTGDFNDTFIVQPESQVEMTFSAEELPPANLWRFDAITSTEIIDNALRGVGNGGVPEAVFIDAGVDNVNRLLDDSQRYFNPFGFIAYYGPWIENGAGKYVPPSPYVTGVAVRRYRSEGYQFPPAGVKYQLADAVSAQIPINSAQQNLLNPQGCNAIRTLPGYPQSAVFIWGGRTRVNSADAQQALYKFVNTRVILNVVYGSLRGAFDSQIFNVIDGFGIVFNQIISVGNSILNQLYVKGALFGATPDQAFQVICDRRINSNADLENGIVNAKVFVTPVPTLERIQIDLIRVAIGNMQNELNAQGLGENNAAGPTAGF